MYKISTQKRKYSATPIVKITIDEQGKEREDIVCICTNQGKADGDALAEKIVNLLNRQLFWDLSNALKQL